MKEYKFCKFCGEKINKDSVVCPKCGRQLEIIEKDENNNISNKTEDNNEIKFYEQEWFMWVMLFMCTPIGIFLMWKFNNKLSKRNKIIISCVLGFIYLIFCIGQIDSEEYNHNDNNYSNTKAKVEVIDFNGMVESEILLWCGNKKINCKIKREYSDTVAKGNYVEQSVSASELVDENSKIIITYSLGKEPTIEQKNALKKAESYSEIMHMSKQGIYDQLVSSYGENFNKEDAQYAIDNIECDWNENALKKAK